MSTRTSKRRRGEDPGPAEIPVPGPNPVPQEGILPHVEVPPDVTASESLRETDGDILPDAENADDDDVVPGAVGADPAAEVQIESQVQAETKKGGDDFYAKPRHSPEEVHRDLVRLLPTVPLIRKAEFVELVRTTLYAKKGDKKGDNYATVFSECFNKLYSTSRVDYLDLMKTSEFKCIEVNVAGDELDEKSENVDLDDDAGEEKQDKKKAKRDTLNKLVPGVWKDFTQTSRDGTVKRLRYFPKLANYRSLDRYIRLFVSIFNSYTGDKFVTGFRTSAFVQGLSPSEKIHFDKFFGNLELVAAYFKGQQEEQLSLKAKKEHQKNIDEAQMNVIRDAAYGMKKRYHAHDSDSEDVMTTHNQKFIKPESGSGSSKRGPDPDLGLRVVAGIGEALRPRELSEARFDAIMKLQAEVARVTAEESRHRMEIFTNDMRARQLEVESRHNIEVEREKIKLSLEQEKTKQRELELRAKEIEERTKMKEAELELKRLEIELLRHQNK